MTQPLLTPNEITEAMAGLPNWTVSDDGKAICRNYKFDDFVAAFAFMAAAALHAEKSDHHPEWSNVYNRVSVTLTTHDAKGITRLDIDLAKAMDAVAA